MRKVTAAIIAPATLPTLFFVGKMISFDASNTNYFRNTTFETIAAILPFSYLFSLTFGIPILFALSKAGRLTILPTVFFGSLGGLLSVVLIFTFTNNLSGLANSSFLLAIAATAGAIVAATFSVLTQTTKK
jgi:hypothetical protein